MSYPGEPRKLGHIQSLGITQTLSLSLAAQVTNLKIFSKRWYRTIAACDSIIGY